MIRANCGMLTVQFLWNFSVIKSERIANKLRSRVSIASNGVEIIVVYVYMIYMFLLLNYIFFLYIHVHIYFIDSVNAHVL